MVYYYWQNNSFHSWWLWWALDKNVFEASCSINDGFLLFFLGEWLFNYRLEVSTLSSVSWIKRRTTWPWPSVFYPQQWVPKWKEGVLTDRNAIGQTDQQLDKRDSSKTNATCLTWRLKITGNAEIIIQLYLNHTGIPTYLFQLPQ